ncbi:hypothetical protein [Parasulfitobacter algicola]|uniref:Uncharacterized protein n=1 Tax=Parasulfitobacter algicola TaxID=2614809 RepID=A0ABX2ITF5_9RHOB|nr:hypothetical protein [Sulfitobacter algicola]NSX55830.1 hypothetical protein [Sulfitobacter algicola]
MPLDKFVLILGCVIGGAAVTIWLGTLLIAMFQIPFIGPVVLIPAILVGYVIWRVVADRVGNAEEDHYDSIEK